MQTSISLRNLLTDAQFLRCDDVHVRSMTSDSRLVEAGSVFVAIRGNSADGHAFVPDAIRRGAAGVITESFDYECAVPQCQVACSATAYAKIATALHFRSQRIQ